MTEVVTVGERGQIVIPKKLRDEFQLHKGTKLLVKEEEDGFFIKANKLDDTQISMILGEETLKKTWDNKHDERWDDVL